VGEKAKKPGFETVGKEKPTPNPQQQRVRQQCDTSHHQPRPGSFWKKKKIKEISDRSPGSSSNIPVRFVHAGRQHLPTS
jgi:hypothetical protein